MNVGKDYLALLIAEAPLVVGVIGWLNHWNAYVNLMLTLGGLVLCVTWVVAFRSPSGKGRQ